MTFNRNLWKTASNLRESGAKESMPKGLSAKIAAAIPPTAPAHTSGRTGAVALPRWIGIGIGVAVVGAGLGLRLTATHRSTMARAKRGLPALVLVNPGDPTVELRNKVRAAVDHANTCHLVLPETANHFGNVTWVGTGAVLSGPLNIWERETAVEIWQRKKPYFYREERAGEILLDDGSKVYHYIPGLKLADARRNAIARLRQLADYHQKNPAVIYPELERALEDEVRAPILQIRPSTGDTPTTGAIAQFEPLRLLLGTDRIPKVPAVEPWATYYHEGVRTTVDSGHKPGATDGPISTSALSISKDSNAPQEFGICETVSSINPQYPNTPQVSSRGRLVIDCQTFLPRRTTLRAIEKSDATVPLDRQRAVERNEMVAQYGITIPPSLFKLTPRPGTTIIDVSGSAARPKATSPQIGELKALSLRAKVSGCDAAANVSFTLQWSLNGKLSRFNDLKKYLPMWLQSLSIVASDGRTCVSTTVPTGNFGDDLINLAAPLEPYDSLSLVPKKLQGVARVVISGNAFGAAINYNAGTYVVAVPFTISLPLAPRSGKAAIGPRGSGSDPLTAMRVAAARADFYLDRINASSTPASASPVHSPVTGRSAQAALVDDQARAVYWTNTAINLANAAGRKGDAKAFSWRFKTLATQNPVPSGPPSQPTP